MGIQPQKTMDDAAVQGKGCCPATLALRKRVEQEHHRAHNRGRHGILQSQNSTLWPSLPSKEVSFLRCSFSRKEDLLGFPSIDWDSYDDSDGGVNEQVTPVSVSKCLSKALAVLEDVEPGGFEQKGLPARPLKRRRGENQSGLVRSIAVKSSLFTLESVNAPLPRKSNGNHHVEERLVSNRSNTLSFTLPHPSNEVKSKHTFPSYGSKFSKRSSSPRRSFVSPLA